MRTVGVDLAASPKSSAVAVIDWSDGAARLVSVTTPATDLDVIRLSTGATRIGIDSPFGWPDAFVDLVYAHHHRVHGSAGVATRGLDEIENRRPLALRRTDRFLIDQGWGRPLSVSADQIAHVAFRCVGLLETLAVSDRVDGWAVEAYPAAALQQWGLRSRGYKRAANRARLAVLTADLHRDAPWLDIDDVAALMATDDNAFDAVITALIARAAELGRTRRPDAADEAVAAREGWIHVPTCGLDDLR